MHHHQTGINRARSISHRVRRCQSGYTLIEAMMGVMIVAMVIVSTLAAIPALLGVIQSAERSQSAANLINNQIEHFRTHPFEVLRTEIMAQSPMQIEEQVNGNTYWMQWELVPLVLNGEEDLAVQTTVSVSWRPRMNSDRTITRTYWAVFSKNGVSDKQFGSTL